MSSITNTESSVAAYADRRDRLDRVVYHAGQKRMMSMISIMSPTIAAAGGAFMLAMGGGNVVGWLGVTILGVTTYGAASRTAYHERRLSQEVEELRRS